MLYSGLSNKQPYETGGRRFSLDEKIAQIREFWKRKSYFDLKTQLEDIFFLNECLNLQKTHSIKQEIKARFKENTHMFIRQFRVYRLSISYFALDPITYLSQLLYI